jgi:predicted metal-binding membrane protein
MARDAIGLERVITVTGLVVVATISWWLLARSAAVMSTMRGEGVFMDLAMAMMEPAATAPYLGASALMWVVMMIAMMTPAVLPVALAFLRLDRRRGEVHGGNDGALFVGGYLLVWSAFALLATLVQWALHRAALLHTDMLAAGPTLAGVILLVAGVYQLTPFKAACLAHCQTPLGFLLSHWQPGAAGALRMGLHHGTYCLGCCWALMLVMFASGVMSVAAMAVLSVFILAERLLPPDPWATHVPGAALIAWGAWTLLHAVR